ncbi:acyltransferase [Leifsonia sp. NPDC058230]|uniref:acyltransferase family protein n=1 Tax=Leifsonia sp. NPDC058230 TaxID=3346391 RepID=UPI0036D9F4DA
MPATLAPTRADTVSTVAAPRIRTVPIPARDATVDIARAWCLTVVVALHALMVGVSVSSDGPVLANALDRWAWFPVFSWFAQIMPLFFVLGGFSSSLQWSRMRARGVRPSEYVAGRMRRLLRPAAVAVTAVVVALAALTVCGVPPEIVATAGFRLSQPLWFLGVYILCTAFVPLLDAAHRRAPVVTVAALAAAVVTVDVVRLWAGVAVVGFANLLFVWVLIQQFGFWLADGWTARREPRMLGALAALALAVLLVLCLTKVYSFDMLVNLNPPTLALVLLGVAQLALFELARPWLRRLQRIRSLAIVVDTVNARAMTVYLWHMLVLIALAGALLLSGARLPVPLSGDWWLTRPLWLVAVAAFVTAVVALAGRVEARRRGGADAAPSASWAWAAYGSAVLGAGGVLVLLVTGFSLAGGILGAALVVGGERLSRPGAGALQLPWRSPAPRILPRA